jgi:PTS system nitrogen regulatory IIA component
MDLSKLLTPAAVRVMGQMTSKKRLFQELGEIASQAYGLTAAMAIDGLQERESLGPTGVGNGIALPHARLIGLEKITGIFLRLEKPLDYESVDRQPVHDARRRHLRQTARQFRCVQALRDPDREQGAASGLIT